MKRIYVPFPNLDIQSRIADFLDDKCGKIDRYIEKQQQIIEKLKAYKQAVITEAVTKGLDPDVPMKDSGNTGALERRAVKILCKNTFRYYIRQKIRT